MMPYIHKCRSSSGSNQPKALSNEYPSHIDQPRKAKAEKKVKHARKKEIGKEVLNIPKLPFDNPSMGTSKREPSPT